MWFYTALLHIKMAASSMLGGNHPEPRKKPMNLVKLLPDAQILNNIFIRHDLRLHWLSNTAYLTKSAPISFFPWSPWLHSLVQTDVLPIQTPCSLAPISAPQLQVGLLRIRECVWLAWSTSRKVHWKVHKFIDLLMRCYGWSGPWMFAVCAIQVNVRANENTAETKSIACGLINLTHHLKCILYKCSKR